MIHRARRSLRPLARFWSAFVVGVFLILGLLPQSVDAIEIQRVEGGGVEAWLVRDQSNPIIALRVAFRGGSAADPDGKAGLARMTAALLNEGAGDMDSQAFQRRLEDLAISLSFDSDRDALRGEMRSLSDNATEAFQLLRLAVLEPRFDPEPVARIRSQILAALRQSEQDPGDRAGRQLAEVLFPDHPYGRPVQGTPETIEAITEDDLRAFVTERFAKDTLILGVVGDIDAAALSTLLEETFADMPGDAAPLAVPDVVPRADGNVYIVDLPVPQSAVLFAQGGLARDDPDFYAARVANRILGGGGATSRLFREVRNDRGLAYSVATWLAPRSHAALWQGYAGTANDRVSETITVIREQWAEMADNGVLEPEVAAAKTFLTGSFPLRFTSSPSIANILVAMQIYDLGIDYLERRNALLEAVTQNDVNRVAARVLHPDHLTIVVAGHPEGLEVEE